MLLLIWLPALASVLLGFTRWEGIGGLDTIEWIGLTNYKNIFTIYPPFWPALQHNLDLAGLLVRAANAVRDVPGRAAGQGDARQPLLPDGALPAGRAVAGPHRIHLAADLLHDQGLLNAVTGCTIDWYGDPKYNLWAVLVATGWQHAGYIMLLYLAGLKGVDPALREAAAVDGASAVADVLPDDLPGAATRST